MTADERLALVQVKVERAKKHIVELDSELGSFFNTKPYEVRTKRNPDTRQLIYYVSRVDPVPFSVPAIAGDAIQNLRSALDHLAQQLYQVGTGSTSMGITSEDIHFPVDESSQQFKASAPRKIQGWRQDAKDILNRIEPYGGGHGERLYILNRLNRIDKHRMLVTLYSQVEGVNLGAWTSAMIQTLWPSRVIPKTDLYFRPADKSPLKAGSELLIDAPDAEENKNMDFRIVISLYEPKVIEGEPVIETVKHLADLVSSTVLCFKPCLN